MVATTPLVAESHLTSLCTTKDTAAVESTISTTAEEVLITIGLNSIIIMIIVEKSHTGVSSEGSPRNRKVAIRLEMWL